MRFPFAVLPLLLSVGLCFVPGLVAQEPPPPSRWEKDIAAYEAADRSQPPQKGGIVFVGSSSIRLWKTLAEDFSHHQVLNRGFGGSQMSDSAHFADRIVLSYAPAMVVVYAGGNDLNFGKTPEQILAAFEALVKKVRDALPDTTIAYVSIAGNPRRWAQVERVKAANALIEGYVGKNHGLKYIDVFSPMLGADGLPLPDIFVADRLHMNAKGYELWTKIIGPSLPAPGR
jgi:lysophospholipase L1-like esterase